MKSLLKKLWNFVFKTEKGLYLVFGGLTTLVSLLVFIVFDTLFKGEHTIISTILKNISGIVFAYFTNRKYVFKSQNIKAKAKTTEALQFFITRGITLLFDMYFTEILISVGIHNIISAAVSTVIVIVLNYIASKLYIFKKKG